MSLAAQLGLLAVMGAGWGLTQPLSKIAVSTGHGHFGLIFWQLVIGVIVMAGLALRRGGGLPLHPGALRTYLIIALIGTVIPNSASFQAIAHIPSGVASIVLSLVPLMAFPIALALRLDRWSMRRMAGLMAGLGGVLLLTLPEASLPDPAMLVWVAVAMIAALCYAFEGNYVACWGTAGADAVQVLFGASLTGAVLTLPLALGSGQFIDPFAPWGAPEWALVAASVIHVLAYAGYVWLVGQAGPVFTAQVGYLVTGFGVVWAMLLLGERYSPFIWAAMGLILLGVFMVQPRRKEALAPGGPIDEYGG